MNQQNLQSERQRQVMNKANLLTNLAYLSADVANSFAIDCMSLIKQINKDYKREEKQRWAELGRLLRLVNANLKALAKNGYETKEADDYAESSDIIYNLLLLISDRADSDMNIVRDIYNTIEQKYPSKMGLELGKI